MVGNQGFGDARLAFVSGFVLLRFWAGGLLN